LIKAGDIEGRTLDVDYPDFRRLVGVGTTRRVVVDAGELRKLVENGPQLSRQQAGSAYPVTVLDLESEQLRLADADTWAADSDRHVAVNREFLLQALDAGGAGQLVLELDGPIKPLAVRVPGDDTRFSILMPVRH
jgi:DNA polymerase III sliding clamp (beta) subunit (PCNA family)